MMTFLIALAVVVGLLVAGAFFWWLKRIDSDQEYDQQRSTLSGPEADAARLAIGLGSSSGLSGGSF